MTKELPKEISGSELWANGFSALANALGHVNAERFVSLVNRERFDYTEWRKENLFPNETVDALYDKIMASSPRRRGKSALASAAR